MNTPEQWFHEHWEMFVTGATVLLLSVRYYLFSSFATKTDLSDCYTRVSKEMKEMRKENNQQHLELMQTILDERKDG